MKPMHHVSPRAGTALGAPRSSRHTGTGSLVATLVALLTVACGSDAEPGGESPAQGGAEGGAQAAVSGCALDETLTLDGETPWPVPCSDPALVMHTRGALSDGVGGLEAVLTFRTPDGGAAEGAECRVGTEGPSMTLPINATEELTVEMLNDSFEEGPLQVRVRTRPRTVDAADCPVIA